MAQLRQCTLLAWTILFVCVAPSLLAQSNILDLTLDEGTWMSLDISPDGKTLLFELLGEIYALPATGGQARPLLTGRAFQSQPRFSPDGATVVYISDESGSDNVWLASSGGKIHGR